MSLLNKQISYTITVIELRHYMTRLLCRRVNINPWFHSQTFHSLSMIHGRQGRADKCVGRITTAHSSANHLPSTEQKSVFP